MLIEEYNVQWPKQFEIIKDVLEKSLKSYVRIEHVGSTSIKGMFAKPIIDIDIEINNKNDLLQIKTELEDIGYVYCGDQGIPGREAFKRDRKNKLGALDTIQHHLYVCASDNLEFRKHILFRDYLRNHKEAVDQYNSIKNDIIRRYGENNREKYVEVKENEYKWFFEDIIEKSKEERKKHPTTASTL